jgi:hypothetical protein
LLPLNLNGWFWSANREKIQPTNRNPIGFGYNPWSQTGHKKVPQPDNAEFDINKTSESCLSVLNNVYNDGIAWVSVMSSSRLNCFLYLSFRFHNRAKFKITQHDVGKLMSSSYHLTVY